MSSQCSYMYCYQKLWLKYISTSNHNNDVKFSFKINVLQLKMKCTRTTWSAGITGRVSEQWKQTSTHRFLHMFSGHKPLESPWTREQKPSHPDNRNLGRINISRMWRYAGNIGDLQKWGKHEKIRKQWLAYTLLEKAYDNWFCDAGLKHQLVERLRQKAASSRLA